VLFGGQIGLGQINGKNVCGDPYLGSNFGNEFVVNLQFNLGDQFAYEFGGQICNLSLGANLHMNLGVKICNKFGGLEVSSEPIVGWF
jgi:hypothetical protein